MAHDDQSKMLSVGRDLDSARLQSPETRRKTDDGCEGGSRHVRFDGPHDGQYALNLCEITALARYLEREAETSPNQETAVCLVVRRSVL
jgi:hypothetical protein